MSSLPRLLLDDPSGFLRWLAGVQRQGLVSFDAVDVAHVVAIAATAALARQQQRGHLVLAPGDTTGAARVASALGVAEVVAGLQERAPTERDRTVTLARVTGRGPW